MMKRTALVFGAASPLLAISGWSAYVTRERRKPPQTTDFVVGSTDDILSEKIKTGDLLFFRRNWAIMQPPAALLALATRKIFDTHFDHVGIIIKDRFGIPFVFEVTQRGIRLRRFDERISWSKSDEIVAVPLAIKPSNEARTRVERYAKSLTPERRMKWAKPSQSMSTELAGLIKYFIAKRKNSDKPDPDFMGTGLVSSRDVALVIAALDKMGMIDMDELEKSDTPPQFLNLKDLSEGRITLKDGNKFLNDEKLLVRLKDRSNS